MIAHNGYVQYGCGMSAPASWTNFDASPTPRLQRIPVVGWVVSKFRPTFPKGIHYGDIVKGLPIAEGSCDAIYCSHVLEHLALDDLRTALRHTFRYLKPGGVFRSVQPDLEFMARAYVSSTEERPAITFLQQTILGFPSRPRGLSGFIKENLGNSRHLWLWDERTLAAELRDVGFTEIRRAQYQDSPDPRFRDVEEITRWENCLGMECKRPA
jgi:SAM-dependent methyltransferase